MNEKINKVMTIIKINYNFNLLAGVSCNNLMKMNVRIIFLEM